MTAGTLGTEDVSMPERAIGQAADMRRLNEDEHHRYCAYVAALRAMMTCGSTPLECRVLRIIEQEADRAMAEATFVAFVEEAGRAFASAAEHALWINHHRKFIEPVEYAWRRANEWQLFKQTDEGIRQRRDARRRVGLAAETIGRSQHFNASAPDTRSHRAHQARAQRRVSAT